jgi:hypothetical protein
VTGSSLVSTPRVQTATRSAVVVNPSKVTDLDRRRRDICAALADAGWPEPLWLETTPDDPGCGQTRELDGDVIEPSRSLATTVRPRALCLCVPSDPPESRVG